MRGRGQGCELLCQKQKSDYIFCPKCKRRFFVDAEEHYRKHLPYCEKPEERPVSRRWEKKPNLPFK